MKKIEGEEETMAMQINPGARVIAKDGPLGEVIAIVPRRDRPDEPGFLVVQRTAGMLLTIPVDTVEQVPSPDVVRLNVGIELAIELDRARRGRPQRKGESRDLDVAEGVRAMREGSE